MKTRINLFSLALVSWAMVIYLIATGNLSWFLWFFIGVLILDRILLQATLWIEAQMLKAMAKQMMEQAQGVAKSSGINLGGQQ